MSKKHLFYLLLTCSLTACAHNSESWLHKSKWASTMGEPVEAITYANRALAYKPDFAEAYLHRGKAYLKIGSQDKSKNDFMQAVQLNPHLFNQHLNDTGIYYPETVEGLSFSTQANIMYQTLQAKHHEHKKDYSQAILDYTELASYHPNLKSVFTLRRGQTFEKLGNCTQANQDFVAACKMGLSEACSKRCQ